MWDGTVFLLLSPFKAPSIINLSNFLPDGFKRDLNSLYYRPAQNQKSIRTTIFPGRVAKRSVVRMLFWFLNVALANDLHPAEWILDLAFLETCDELVKLK